MQLLSGRQGAGRVELNVRRGSRRPRIAPTGQVAHHVRPRLSSKSPTMATGHYAVKSPAIFITAA